MKPRYLLCFLLLASAWNAKTQIPNSGFETWTNMGTYTNPESWGTLNNKWASSGIFTATEGTPGNPGNSYLKLTSRLIGPWVRNGVAVSGVLDSMNLVPISGFAFSGQPAAFTGQWQHMIFGSTQGSITVVLTKWNTALNKRDTLAKAYHELEGMAMSWEAFSIPFQYDSFDLPDSCIIFMKASGSTPEADDYLWLDDLAFSGTAVAGTLNGQEKPFLVSVYPNPATEGFVTFCFNSPGESNANVTVYTPAGELLFSKDCPVSANQVKLDLTGVAAGIYLVRITSGELVWTAKLLI
jgi:hypothetical protein